MSTTTPAEMSLINDVEFLERLERWDPQPAAPAARAVVEPQETFADAFELVEQALPVTANAAPAAEPRHVDDGREDLREELRIPYAAAAAVLVACLIAGAASAAALFHDRLAQITAPRSASR